MPTETPIWGIVKPASGAEPPNGYGALGALADSVEDALVAGVTPSTWTAPTFTNSWVDYGGGHQVAQYRKINDRVELRGRIKTGTMGTSAFTLPSGFRPPASASFAVDSNGAFGNVVINTDGTVVPTIGSNTSVRLNGISFSVTA